MVRSVRSRSLLLGLSAVILIAFACGDDPVSSDNGGDRAASAVISGTGGEVVLSTPSGAQLRLTIPSGAIVDSLLFELRELAADSSELLRFQLSPTQFLNESATLTLALPSGLVVGSTPVLALDGTILDSDYDPGSRTLSASTSFLGFATGASPVSAAAVVNAGILTAGNLDCSDLVQSLNAKIALVQSGGANIAELVTQILNEFATLSTDCPEQAPDAAAIEAAIQTAACAEYGLALDDLSQDPPPSGAAEVKAKLDRVVAAQALKFEFGADCGSPDDFEADITPVFEAYIQKKLDDFGDPEFVLQFETWDDLWLELKAVFEVSSLAGSFALADAVELILNEVVVPLMDLFRDKAYRAGFGPNGEHGYIADLAMAGALMDHKIGDELPTILDFDLEDLQRDLQYCASRLDVVVTTAAGDTSESHILDQDILDYSVDNSISVNVDADGQIILNGLIRAIRCWDTPPFPDRLVIRADGQPIDTLMSSNGILLEDDYTIDIAGVLNELGLQPPEVVTFVVRRDGMCDDFLGFDFEFDLFTITANVGEQESTIYSGDHETLGSWFAEGSPIGFGGPGFDTDEDFGFGENFNVPFQYALEFDSTSFVADVGLRSVALVGDFESIPSIVGDPQADSAVFTGYQITVSGVFLQAISNGPGVALAELYFNPALAVGSANVGEGTVLAFPSNTQSVNVTVSMTSETSSSALGFAEVSLIVRIFDDTFDLGSGDVQQSFPNVAIPPSQVGKFGIDLELRANAVTDVLDIPDTAWASVDLTFQVTPNN